jgi:hypothetical protein
MNALSKPVAGAIYTTVNIEKPFAKNGLNKPVFQQQQQDRGCPKVLAIKQRQQQQQGVQL